MHDVNDHVRAYTNVHGQRLSVRPVGPALLLSVHAEIMESEEIVRWHGCIYNILEGSYRLPVDCRNLEC